MSTRTIFSAALLAGVVATACTSGSQNSTSVPVGGPTAVATTPAASASDTLAPNDTPDTASPAADTTTSIPEPDPTEPATTPAPTTPPAPTTIAPTTTAAPVFFRQGDEDPAIAVMQLKLITLGYLTEGSATGVFGPATNTALRNFQAQYGLGVDGVFGPITDRSLTAAANSVNVDEG